MKCIAFVCYGFWKKTSVYSHGRVAFSEMMIIFILFISADMMALLECITSMVYEWTKQILLLSCSYKSLYAVWLGTYGPHSEIVLLWGQSWWMLSRVRVPIEEQLLVPFMSLYIISVLYPCSCYFDCRTKELLQVCVTNLILCFSSICRTYAGSTS